ncbi:MAG: hypothetical protein WCA46_00470 [Actinocatenispora sp.]
MAYLSGRVRSAAGTCAIATLVLVLAFGNPAFVDWVHRNESDQTGLGLFLRTLAWPSWHLRPINGSGEALRDLIAADLTAILLIVLVAVLVGAVISRGGFGVFLAGWGCFIIAAGVAGFLAAFIGHDASIHGSMIAAAGGATYGMFVGWLIGLAAITGKH